MRDNFIQQVQEILVKEILSGGCLTEQNLAERLGVSRTPVREALSTLEEQGLLERRKNAGIKFRQPNLREIVEIYDLRTALEGMASRILATHLGQKTLQELESLSRNCDRLSETRPFSDPENQSADIKFHQKLVDGCGNRYLKRVADTFHILTMSFHLRHKFNKEWEPKKLRFSHQRILEDLRTRNPEKAEKITRLHIQEGKEHIIEEILGPSSLHPYPVPK